MNDVLLCETEETELGCRYTGTTDKMGERLWKIRKIRRRNINGESGIPEHIREIIKKKYKELNPKSMRIPFPKVIKKGGIPAGCIFHLCE